MEMDDTYHVADIALSCPWPPQPIDKYSRPGKIKPFLPTIYCKHVWVTLPQCPDLPHPTPLTDHYHYPSPPHTLHTARKNVNLKRLYVIPKSCNCSHNLLEKIWIYYFRFITVYRDEQHWHPDASPPFLLQVAHVWLYTVMGKIGLYDGLLSVSFYHGPTLPTPRLRQSSEKSTGPDKPSQWLAELIQTLKNGF